MTKQEERKKHDKTLPVGWQLDCGAERSNVADSFGVIFCRRLMRNAYFPCVMDEGGKKTTIKTRATAGSL